MQSLQWVQQFPKERSTRRATLTLRPKSCVELGCKAIGQIFSFGTIALVVLDLLPTATARSIKMAKLALKDDPEQRGTLKELLTVLYRFFQ